MRNVPLVFVDTETTGLSYNRQTWEIAMVRDEPDGSTERFQFMLPVLYGRYTPKNWSPILGNEINETSLKISKFHHRHFQGNSSFPFTKECDGLSYADAAYNIYRMTNGAHMIGMCPDFDAFNLWRILISQGMDELPWYYQLIDVDILSAGNDIGHDRYGRSLVVDWSNHYPTLPYDTDDATRRYGLSIKEEDRHTAMGDTLWTREFYYSIVGGEIPGES